MVLTLCHPLDYMSWLFGRVDSLWALAGSFGDLDLPVEDTAEIAMRFQTGVLGSVHLDYNRRPASHHLEIVGTLGTIQWDNTDGVTRVYRVSDQSWQVFAPPQGFERNDMFIAQMRHFLNVTRGQSKPICSLEDGIRALELALGALESAQKGKFVKISQRYARSA